MKNNKEHDSYISDKKDLAKKHSFVCNDELFMKDLTAIVDDTMRVEEDEIYKKMVPNQIG